MKTEKRKFYDFFLIAFLLMVAAIFALLNSKGSEGSFAVVSVDGKEVARYPLNSNGVYKINNGTNVLEIKDGFAMMVSADCPDLLCVKQEKINSCGQSIVCLPNRLMITISGAEGAVDLVI